MKRRFHVFQNLVRFDHEQLSDVLPYLENQRFGDQRQVALLLAEDALATENLLALATVNVVGGFLVTGRMLAMFKKK